MNVSLSPELEHYVSAKVETGLYQSASEVVREALQALREKEEYALQKANLIADLQRGIENIEDGKGVPVTKELIQKMKDDGRNRIAKKQ